MVHTTAATQQQQQQQQQQTNDESTNIRMDKTDQQKGRSRGENYKHKDDKQTSCKSSKRETQRGSEGEREREWQRDTKRQTELRNKIDKTRPLFGHVWFKFNAQYEFVK